MQDFVAAYVRIGSKAAQAISASRQRMSASPQKRTYGELASRCPLCAKTEIAALSDSRKLGVESCIVSCQPGLGFRFDRSFLAIAMAVDGLGVALESTLLAEREIASGRLVAPLLDRSESIHYVGHYLVSPKGLHQRRPLRVFTQWLSRELKLDHRFQVRRLPAGCAPTHESDSRIVANSAFVMAAATDKITANKKNG